MLPLIQLVSLQSLLNVHMYSSIRPFGSQTVPSDAPNGLIEISRTDDYVNFTWIPIDYLDQNGPNFQYVVFYAYEGSEMNTTTDMTFKQLMNLMECTQFNITVGTQNSKGLHARKSDILTFITPVISSKDVLVMC